MVCKTITSQKFTPSACKHNSALMDDDKWKVIEEHMDMMAWTKHSNISSSPSNQQTSVSTRQGHTHRRSEPNVGMIREALPQPEVSNNVPQSAPVQPGCFDWPSMSSGAPNASPKTKHVMKPTDTGQPVPEVVSLPGVHHAQETNGIFYPTPMRLMNETSILGSVQHNNYVTDPNARNAARGIFGHGDSGTHSIVSRVPPPYPSDNHIGGGTSAPGSGSSSPFLIKPESPSLIKFGPHNHIGSNTPPTLGIPITQGIVRPSPRGILSPSSKALPHSQSPVTNRRSSAPGNQVDPRSHSASPSMARRSTSHSSALMQAKTNTSRYISSPQNTNSVVTSQTIGRLKNHPFQPITTATPENLPMPIMPTITTKSPISMSIINDSEYTKVLLQHQHERMERLQQDLNSKKQLLESLTRSVADMEKKVFQRRNEKLSASVPTLQNIAELRKTNRQMEIDCKCMTREIELVSKSGVSMNRNFHESIRKKSLKKNYTDLPSPPPPPPPDEDDKWSCNYCTFLNHAALDKCEMCEYRRETHTLRSRPSRT